MTVIPNFIIKRMYVNGSFRRVPDGVAFDIHNNLGPGMITSLNHIKYGETTYPSSDIVIEVNGVRRAADTISEAQPVIVSLGQTANLIVLNAEVPNGKHDISIDLLSREGGHVVLTVTDTLS